MRFLSAIISSLISSLWFAFVSFSVVLLLAVLRLVPVAAVLAVLRSAPVATVLAVLP
jgi:hypothetical protein